jgi:ADP-ribose pyrophosphatase YjhB (NUDIX family)
MVVAEAVFQIGQKAVIINDKKQVLMVGQKLKGMDFTAFDFPGGRINENEDDTVAELKREVYEELRVDIEVGDVISFCLTKKRPQQKHRIALVLYECHITSGTPDTSKDDDVFCHKWVNINELAKVRGIRYSPDTIQKIKDHVD